MSSLFISHVFQNTFQNCQEEVLGRTDRLLSFDRHGLIGNDASSNSSFAAEACLPSHCLATIGGIHSPSDALIRHGPHRKRVQQFFCCCVCICCRRNFFTEQLPSNIHARTHRQHGDRVLRGSMPLHPHTSSWRSV
jgi:hypothetical protein